MDNINFTEMKLLCYRYVDENCDCFSLLKDVIKLIFDKCEVIPTFDGKRERKVLRRSAGMLTWMCSNIFRKIECFEENGYTSGVRYLSIKFQYGGCTNDFGITNKRDYVRKWEKQFPELLKAHDVSNYKMAYREYDFVRDNDNDKGHIITIKLDCQKWTVTFYKDYKQILIHETIKQDTPYWFYMYYCQRSGQLFEIVRTDVLELDKNCKENQSPTV
eukprot:212316_1